MRVLFLYKDYFPVVGGIENHVRLLATGLRTEGVDARVLVTNTGRHTVHETIDGVPVTKAGRQANFASAPLSLQFFAEVRRQERGVDIVHAHFPYPPGEVAHLMLGRSRRFVITYHSDIVRQKVLGLLYRPLLRHVLRKAHLLTVSNPLQIESSPFLRPLANKCRVIHLGQDLDRFAATPENMAAAATWRARFGNRPLVLFVGRMRHYKGVDVLIRATAHLSHDAQVLLVGTGPMGHRWQRLTRELELTTRVHFLGELTEEDLPAVYRAADLFVLPSTNRAETWGTVLIEAMASGLPLVCSELGTGTSYVNQHGRTGLVVPPNDPAALAAAVNRLLANPENRRQLGLAGMARAEDQFSKGTMIRQLVAFYAEALEEPA